jgi:hypothetical protein
MRIVSRRLLQLYALMIATMAMGQTTTGTGEAGACANCTTPTKCDGDLYTGYTSCGGTAGNPCQVELPKCGPVLPE